MTQESANMTDKQAMSALKKHSGTFLWVIVAVLAAYFGWGYYQKNYAKVDTVAADAYTSIEERNDALKLAQQNPDLDATAKQSVAKDESALFADVDKLVAEHPDTAYAWQALMLKARQQSDAGKLSDAIATLEKAQGLKVKDAGLLAIADLRLARVLLDNKELDKALALANKELPKAFEGSRQELLGDIYVAKNDVEAAKKAYSAAWEALRERQENRAVLSLKLQSLGVEVEPITPKTAIVATPSQSSVASGAQDEQAGATNDKKAATETQTTQNGN